MVRPVSLLTKKMKMVKIIYVIGISEFNSYKDLKKILGKNELIKIKQKSSNITKKLRKKRYTEYQD